LRRELESCHSFTVARISSSCTCNRGAFTFTTARNFAARVKMRYTIEVFQTTAGWSATAELKDTAIVGRSNFKDLPLVISREHLRLYVEATGEVRIECIGRNSVRIENEDGSLSAVRTGSMALLHPGVRVLMDMTGDHVVRVMPAHVLEAAMNVASPMPLPPLLDDGDTAEPLPSLLPPAPLEPHQRAACEPMPLDVREASRQLQRSKTAVVQCADGTLLLLRQINESVAVGELLHGGGDRAHPPRMTATKTAS
jgi:hypothetical protein